MIKRSFFLILYFFLFLPLYAQQEADVVSKLFSQNQEMNISSTSSAQEEQAQEETHPPSIVTMMLVLALVSLLPYAMILFTAFLKIVIVLSLLRNALGVQQSPPNPAISGIAVLMSIYVMFPTSVMMYNAGKDYITKEAPNALMTQKTAIYIYNIIDKTKEPLKHFLMRNMSASHQRSFYRLAYKSMPNEIKPSLKIDDFIILAPAYITSQLKGAFEIGVLIYLPFFVIDLVTSNILLAMGMMMLSPLTIALPLKLLLIVMTDGWTLIIQGLVQTYR